MRDSSTLAWWAGALLVTLAAVRMPVDAAAGAGLAIAGSALLALRSLAQAFPASAPRVQVVLLALAELAWVAVFATVLGAAPWTATPVALGALVAGSTQLLLLALAARHSVHGAWRALLLLGGHGVVLVGIVRLLMLGRLDAGVVLLLAFAFPLLVLEAFWTQQRAAAEARRSAWEMVALAALAGALVASAALHLGFLFGLPRSFWIALAWLGAGWSLATLAAPPDPPRWLATGARNHGSLMQASFLCLMTNSGLLLVAGSTRWSGRTSVIVVSGLIALAVLVEYLSVRHHLLGRKGADDDPPPAREAVTVVVAARDDGESLARTLPENLAVPRELRFLLVVSTRSTDDTLDVARRFAQQAPEKVRVLASDSGSKSSDLNRAWQAIETELVLVLDADETIDARSLDRAVHHLRGDPSLGILQGRKWSRHPDLTPYHRFVAAERRHSTRLDHPFHSDNLGSAHFAGSGALLRRGVAEDVGGWHDNTLTEDIEFTLRVHLRTAWRIRYDPHVVVRETDPLDLRALLLQRTRWARGWLQCFAAHFVPILRGRRGLGHRRAAGLAFMLLTSASAPLMTLFPAVLALRVAGTQDVLPLWIALPLALLVLPARMVGYTVAALHDPVSPVPRTPRALAEVVLHAYGWMVFGWFIQLRALYLELARAPSVWKVTPKVEREPGASL